MYIYIRKFQLANTKFLAISKLRKFTILSETKYFYSQLTAVIVPSTKKQ